MTTPRPAATYLRSSKDRSDVSIESQRRVNAELAARQGLTLVREYADVVLSGKDDNRPAFLELLRDLRRRDRGWAAIVIHDPERLARNRYVATFFEFDCERFGVQVIYADMPDSNPMTQLFMAPVRHAAAHWFSWQSKVKGLGGMKTNVLAGWRAGGRAPAGYRLEHVATGAVREGQPVLKSRLVASEEAQAIGAYLAARAAGISRQVASRALPRALAHTTLIGMEWNALTYAGHTVWNVHNEYRAPRMGQNLERVAGGYAGGKKRRPRAEWTIQRNTHQALIDDDQAERILAALEASPYKPTRRSAATALLTGLLKTADGAPWYSDNGGLHYRVGKKGQGRKIRAATVDQVVLRRISADLVSPRFVAAAYAGTLKQYRRGHGKELAELRAQDQQLQERTGRFLDMAAALETPAPVLRKVDEVERERVALAGRIRELEDADRRASALAQLTEDHVAQYLRALADEVQAYDRERLKDFLLATIERVELEPGGLNLEICYRIPVQASARGTAERGNKMASPRLSDAIPLIYRTRVRVA